MKVLSIKEPYASFIKNGDKLIETRSFKTNYRGELYIHASGKRILKEYMDNEYVYELMKGMDLSFGKIICKCQLVDCIYMDDKFIKEIKNNQKEYMLGRYEVGRYAWILKDIQVIEPIVAKGKLNIWNYDENIDDLIK